MTFPHVAPEGPKETGELVMLDWSCACGRHVVSSSANPPQLPCAQVPYLSCASEVIEQRRCG